MPEWLPFIGQFAGLAELAVTAIGAIILATLALGKKLTSPRRPSSEEIAREAAKYIERYDDRATNHIGAEMRQERVANGISVRYRFLREISGCLCSWRSETRDGAKPPSRKRRPPANTIFKTGSGSYKQGPAPGYAGSDEASPE